MNKAEFLESIVKDIASQGMEESCAREIAWEFHRRFAFLKRCGFISEQVAFSDFDIHELASFLSDKPTRDDQFSFIRVHIF